MYKNKSLGGCIDRAKQLGYVETDPSGRYGRFREILGKGAVKTVYKAFDEVLAMEVAWNQVKLNEVFSSPEELQRLYCEVHLLKNLNHGSLIRFYASWIDVDRRTFNFITEMFTSGTLREYRQKYWRLDIRAVKNWARQILQGLAYLHGHDPPVIHRDLKCDNVFINGHLGQVKIGDLGLAAILRGSQHAHSVIGTPEFMAPELYDEDYNELVDVYSFGMCVLEMLTSEYPYSECSNPAQIYKKVTSGKLPEAFYRIQDAEAQQFVGKCLENVSKRLPAKELLLDPFLASDEGESLLIPKGPCQNLNPNGAMKDPVAQFMVGSDQRKSNDMTITGTMNPEDDTIFLKVQISDNKDGNSRNIYFPFNIFNDTATKVAMEMVKELEITDWEPLEIAEMIEEEIFSLFPNWKGYGSLQFHHQQRFSYDDDGGTNHPFSSNSSHSSDHHASLPGLVINAEDLLGNDDGSSCNNLDYYYSGNEDECDLSFGGEPLCFSSRATQKPTTRFCPGAATNKNYNNRCCSNSGNVNSCCRPCCCTNLHRKFFRNHSHVDVRSRLLLHHRSMVEEINKRRLFKTVGAIENIGYHEPAANCGSSGRSHATHQIMKKN